MMLSFKQEALIRQNPLFSVCLWVLPIAS